MVTVTTQYRYLHCILKLKLNLNRLELAKRIKILLVLALGPSHRGLARAFNSRPETSPTRAIPEPDPGPEIIFLFLLNLKKVKRVRNLKDSHQNCHKSTMVGRYRTEPITIPLPLFTEGHHDQKRHLENIDHNRLTLFKNSF